MEVNVISTARAKLSLVVHQFPGQNPHNRHRAAVQSGQEIKSGQVCSVVKNTSTNQLEFIRGVDLDDDGGGADTKLTAGELICIAHGNSDDRDVKNSGLLTGLSSVGGFEISTAYFDATKTYKIGDLLIPDGTTGNLIPYTAGDITDIFTVDNDQAINTFIVGRVTHDYSPPVDFKAQFTPNAGVASSTSPGVTGAEFKVGRRYGATNLQMLRLELMTPRPLTVPAA